MMHRRCSKVLRALLLVAATAGVPLFCVAQAAPAGTQPPSPSFLDIFGGYSYFHPVDTSLDGYSYAPIDLGSVVSVTGYFSNHFGVQAEGAFSPHGPNDCDYKAEAGPVYRIQYGRFIPFAHLLFGGEKLGGPLVQPCTWGYGGTFGIGSDYVLPYAPLHNHLALRLFQADYEYAHINYGPNTAPTYFNGGVTNLSAYRLSAGLVLRLSATHQQYPAAYGCVVQPVTVFPGDPITVTGTTLNLETGKKLKPVYTWATTGGQITGDTATATISTTGTAPGDYVVTGRVDEGRRPTEHAECAASFRIQAFSPPTISCSADPSTVLPGGSSTITSEGRSPQNRPLNYSYATTAGQIGGTGSTGTLTTANVSPGIIDVTCTVVDDLGKTATANTTVTVVAPPPPPAPSARSLCSVSFERDRRRPVRVDNEAKGCLDDIALELNRESSATLIVVGQHGPREAPETAAQRALNIKQYLVDEKGIDPSRIELRTGGSTGRTAENILVPPGATWNTGGTTRFDATKVMRHGEPYARPRR